MLIYMCVHFLSRDISLRITAMYNNRPATVALVSVNGYYPGDPVEIDIYPPPRPSPDAIVASSSQLGSDAPVDVNVESTLVASSFIRLRITASPRRVTVTNDGMMTWETGRNYDARWYVFWTEP